MILGNLLRAVLYLSVALTLSSRAWAANATVHVSSSGFSPDSVSINVHEWISFVVVDDNGPYCIQSTIGAWPPWYLFEQDDAFAMQIHEAGDYYYRDIAYGNTGVIHVGTGTNVPPVVHISSPCDGATFPAPASFSWTADITDADTGISRADFYLGPEFLATVYAPPFSVAVTDLGVGAYTLTVIAYDNALVSTTNSVNISVQESGASSITLGSPAMASGEFTFDASGLKPGRPMILEVSSTLGPSVTWVPIQTNNVSTETVKLIVPATAGAHFFRVFQP